MRRMSTDRSDQNDRGLAHFAESAEQNVPVPFHRAPFHRAPFHRADQSST